MFLVSAAASVPLLITAVCVCINEHRATGDGRPRSGVGEENASSENLERVQNPSKGKEDW